MTLRHLEIFLTVYEEKTMTKAATKLYISQPAISQAIAELEQYYGVCLFERLNQRLYITDNGKKILPHVRYLMETFNDIDHLLSDNKKKQLLRIGASVSVGTMIIPYIVSHMEKEGITVEVIINNTSVIEQLIMNNECDVAIVEGSISNQYVQCTKVGDDELVLVAGKKHPFYAMKEIELSMLCQQALITREDGSDERNQWRQLLKENHIDMQRKWTVSNTEAIKNALRAGIGVSFLSKMMVEQEVSSKEFNIISVKGYSMKRDLLLIHHKDKFMSEALMMFKQYLMQDSIEHLQRHCLK